MATIITLLILIYTFLYILTGGFVLKKDYCNFYRFLMKLCEKENIIVSRYKTIIVDINLNTGDKKPILGRYIYSTKKNIIPIIEWCDKDIFGRINLFSLMTLAHELGHHYAIKNEKDRSEYKANLYALIFFMKHFSLYKKIIYFPVIYYYLITLIINYITKNISLLVKRKS